MNRIRQVLAAGVMSAALGAAAGTATQSFWWHFNGTDGGEAPSTLTDASGSVTLSRTLLEPAVTTPPETQSDSLGTAAYWKEGSDFLVDESVAGAVRMYRFNTDGKYSNVNYCLDDASTRQVLPVNGDGEILPFTIEMVYKCDPWDADLGGTAKNLTFATIRRRWGKNSVGNVMNVCGLNGGDLYVQGSGANESTGLKVVNNRFIVGSDSYRDGKWHHLAVVYSLDVSKTPHQGNITLYLDYQSKGSVNCKLVDESNRAGLIYQPSSDLSAETTAELSFGEIGVNYRSSMVLDEVRVTQAALDVEELFRIGNQAAAFYFPLGLRGEPTMNVDGKTVLTATGVEQADLLPARTLTDGSSTIACPAAVELTGAGSLSVSELDSLLMAKGPFTLETTFRTESPAAQILWSKGTEWSVTLDGGTLKWNHGAASESVATGLADGAWHSVALVYVPAEESATVTFAIDGVMQSACADTLPIAKVAGGELVLGSGFVGQLLGFRQTPRARTPDELLTLAPVVDDGLSYWWHFNGSDGEEAPATLVDRSGTFELARKQATGSGEMGPQLTQADCMAERVTWAWNGHEQFDSDVGGSIRMFRRTDNGAGRCYAADYYLSDSSRTKQLFAANDSGELKPFTLEMMFKVAPYDETLHGTAKNLCLASLGRISRSTSGAIFNISAVSSGSLYLQCNSRSGGGVNADVLNQAIADEAAFRDGAWHHLACVYELDESVTPHQGSFAFYLDHRPVGTCSCKTVTTSTGSLAALSYVPSNATVESDGFFSLGDMNANYGGETSIDEVRVTQKALAPEELFRASIADGQALAYWPMTTAAADGTTVEKLSDSLGRSAFTMSPVLMKGSDDTYKPTWSHEVPGKCIWNPANGKILNVDNRSSVAIHNNATYDEDKQTWVNNGGGGYLKTDGSNANFGDAYTLEMFIKPTHQYAQYMSVIYQNLYADKRYVLIDAQYGVNANVKVYTPGHAEDPNAHIGAFGTMTPGEWHHLAVTVSQDTENVTITGVLDYDTTTSVSQTYPGPYSLTEAASVLLGWGGGQVFDGLIDELRVTRGVLPASFFMRVFEPRANLTGVWLLDGAAGIEHFNNGTYAYLDGVLADGATASDDLPIAEPVFRVKGKGIVRPTSSVLFDGTGGLVLSGLAVTGADDFTVEATVRGSGTIAERKGAEDASWSFGLTADGKPTLRIGADEVTAQESLDVSAWHHLALVCNPTAGVAKLYADSSVVAEIALSGLSPHDGDFVWGGDFVGKMIAARFAPGALTPDGFLVAGERRGLMLIFR